MITPEEQDTLTEVVNVAFGRTAAALSELTGYRVELETPELTLSPISELGAALSSLAGSEVVSVHQIFTGPMAGSALLLLSDKDAATLARLLVGADPQPAQLGPSESEVLVEVGNILLSACLGTFGNLLRVQVSFTVPRLYLEDLHGLLSSLVVESEGLAYGLVIVARFRLRETEVCGRLVIVLGVSSLDRLFQEIRKLESRHV